VVNLLGPTRRRPRHTDLESELTSDRRLRLDERLADVRRWWTRLPADLPIDRRARTRSLEPRLEDEPTLAALDAALLVLAQKRARLCDSPPVAGPSDRRPAPTGRLLVCEFDLSLGGGESEVASRSLFDLDDRPPWDLWLVVWGRTRANRPDEPLTCLLAWIPDEWWGHAEAGIAANPTRMLYWVD
jgi:hypothetical protein